MNIYVRLFYPRYAITNWSYAKNFSSVRQGRVDPIMNQAGRHSFCRWQKRTSRIKQQAKMVWPVRTNIPGAGIREGFVNEVKRPAIEKNKISVPKGYFTALFIGEVNMKNLEPWRQAMIVTASVYTLSFVFVFVLCFQNLKKHASDDSASTLRLGGGGIIALLLSRLTIQCSAGVGCHACFHFWNLGQWPVCVVIGFSARIGARGVFTSWFQIHCIKYGSSATPGHLSILGVVAYGLCPGRLISCPVLGSDVQRPLGKVNHRRIKTSTLLFGALILSRRCTYWLEEIPDSSATQGRNNIRLGWLYGCVIACVMCVNKHLQTSTNKQ